MAVEYQEPTQRELELQALEYLKSNKRKEYRETQQLGGLSVYCHAKAIATRLYAEKLIASGEVVRDAWNRAIHREILEKENG